MKKNILIGTVLFTVLILMTFQLYRTRDIQFLDDIVEATTETIGIKSELVEAKKQRKIERERNLVIPRIEPSDSTLMAEKLQRMREELEQMEFLRIQARRDSIRMAFLADSIAFAEKRNSIKFVKKTSEVTPAKEEAVEAVPAVAMVDSAAIQPTKKSPFTIKRKVVKTASVSPPVASNTTKSFAAIIHGAQKVVDEGDVMIRLVEDATIGSQTIPSNTILKAKVNVFDNRFYFVINELEKQPIDAEGYGADNQKGLAIKDENKLRGGYLLANGVSVNFKYN